MERLAMFISIDGADCTGKSTLASGLYDRLTQEGHKVKVLHFPRYETPLGALIKEYLTGKEKIDVTAIQHLYLADQLDYTGFCLQEDLKNYDYVICDRYEHSNLVYYSVTEKIRSISEGYSADERIKAFSELQQGICMTDVQLILYLDDPVLLERLAQKSDRDLFEVNGNFMRIINKTFADIRIVGPDGAEAQPINVTDLTPEELVEKALKLIQKKKEDYEKWLTSSM